MSPLPTSDDSMGVMPLLANSAGADSTATYMYATGEDNGVARKLAWAQDWEVLG